MENGYCNVGRQRGTELDRVVYDFDVLLLPQEWINSNIRDTTITSAQWALNRSDMHRTILDLRHLNADDVELHGIQITMGGTLFLSCDRASPISADVIH